MESETRWKQGFAPRWMWFVWSMGLVVWTYLLVAPVGWLPPWLRFGGSGFSKLLTWSRIGHASAYAMLSAIIPFMPVARGARRALWCLLIAHAGATEYVQSFVPTRTGSWIDVAADFVGIAIGWALGLIMARQGKSAPVESQEHAG